MKIFYPPLSVNLAWKGRRFKTDAYKQYERDLLFLLPKFAMPEKPYSIVLKFGMSNAASDFDNPVKMFIDVLQKKYGFNDKDILSASIYKIKVDKGDEFIDFKIEHYEI